MSSSSKALSSWAKAASVYLDRRVIAILFLGFSSGLPLALTGATLSVWLVEGGVAKTAIGMFALVGLPYTLKFAWAPLIDRLRLPVLTRLLGRRRGRCWIRPGRSRIGTGSRRRGGCRSGSGRW